MHKKILHSFKWLKELSKVCFENAPLETLAVIAATLISQLSLMIAFLLPIKVIMLLGANTIPTFIPAPFNSFEKNTIILSLGALTFCFYGITIISNKLCDDSLSLGINKLLQKSKKIVLFENQDEIAIRAYTKYTEAVSSFIFALIGIILLSILYIDAGIAITLTITFTLLIFITFSNLNILFKNKSLDDIQNNIRKFSDISFMLTFVFIVLDFLYFTPPKFIIAIIAIILSRVLLARLFITINHLLSLNKQKEKINTLFFQNHHISSKQNDTKNSVWDLLELHSRHEWITELLKQTSINTASKIDIKWNETSLQNIVVITDPF